jgi:hypothetical protein
MSDAPKDGGPAQSNACSALVMGLCTNGFMVNPYCDPIKAPSCCPTCRRAYDKQGLPMCMNEAWCADWLEDSGGRPSDERVANARKQVAALLASREAKP